MTIEDVLQVKVQQRSSDHFKDLYKLYFLMVVCFKARATCHYCPSCLKILWSIQKWSKSTWKYLHSVIQTYVDKLWTKKYVFPRFCVMPKSTTNFLCVTTRTWWTRTYHKTVRSTSQIVWWTVHQLKLIFCYKAISDTFNFLVRITTPTQSRSWIRLFVFFRCLTLLCIDESIILPSIFIFMST